MNRSILLYPLLALAAMPGASRAANSFDACTGFITSLPALVTTQGTWCFNRDLSFNPGTGEAIIVAANNVTIDCNGFKLGGLSGGPGTTAVGIASGNRQNTTVRGCNIRGFLVGVGIEGIGSGHLVEDNRFDNNRFAGILVQGEGAQVHRNRVFDTGGGTMPVPTLGIAVTGGSTEVRDNLVFGVEATPGSGSDAYGIVAQGLDFGRIAGNSVRFVVPDGAGTGWGIGVQAALYVAVDDNHVATVGTGGVGIGCDGDGTLVRDNLVQGFATPLDALCRDEGGNASFSH